MSTTVTDKKLSSEERKKLPSSVFCGPNKSFPVPDCKHVRAALSLLGRYKGPGDKDKIRACIYRRAKALNCFKKKSDTNMGELDTVREFYVMAIDGIIPNDGEGMAILMQLCSCCGVSQADVLSVMQVAVERSIVDGLETLISKISRSK